MENSVYRSLREPLSPTFYLPVGQWEVEALSPDINISFRPIGGKPESIAKGVMEAISAVDKDLSLTMLPLAAQIDASLAQESLVAILSGFFGGLALLLAGIGLYGITAYSVSTRRREIGIRMALGARPAGIVRMVVVRVAVLVGLGVAIGAIVSLWITRYVDKLLFGLRPNDPVTLAAAALVLAVIGVVAGWLPARRAARIQPAEVLREG